MSKLNKIFFGPAGTGKTRRAIEEAIKIVTKSSNVEMQVDKKKTDYGILGFGDENKLLLP
jgi:replication-associated recombination protein RarA